MGPPRSHSEAPRSRAPDATGSLRLVREGDGAGGLSFDDFFRRHHRLVAAIGLRMLGRAADVEDFVQDVFLEAHRGYAKIREPAAAKGWLRSIAVRKAIRRLRRRRVAMALGLDRPDPLETAPYAANQEQAVLLQQIYRVLEHVPAKAKVVWVLRVIEGEKLEDIAAMTGMGLSSVKRHLSVATAELEGLLDE